MRPLALFVAFFSLPVHAAPLEVATDIPPVAALVADVQGGRGTVTAVAPSDADVHHLSLRPSQARALAQADVAVWIGPGVTGWFGSAMNSLAPDTPALSLLPGAPVRLPLRGGDGTDPHVWMAPENAIAALDQIAEALSAADRDGAAHYRAQAKAAAEAIRAAAAAVPRAEGARYVAAHDSLQYAEALSGLTFVGSITDGHNHSPGAAHLHELETALEDGGADCLFVEPGETTKLVRQVAEKGGPAGHRGQHPATGRQLRRLPVGAARATGRLRPVGRAQGRGASRSRPALPRPARARPCRWQARPPRTPAACAGPAALRG